MLLPKRLSKEARKEQQQRIDHNAEVAFAENNQLWDEAVRDKNTNAIRCYISALAEGAIFQWLVDEESITAEEIKRYRGRGQAPKSRMVPLTADQRQETAGATTTELRRHLDALKRLAHLKEPTRPGGPLLAVGGAFWPRKIDL